MISLVSGIKRNAFDFKAFLGIYIVLLLSTLLLIMSVSVGIPLHAQTTNTTPKLKLGVAAGPDQLDWAKGTQVPWSNTYAYLVGGVNTGTGWETWNPIGTYALNYAKKAGSYGYVPVFTYYEMQHSSGCANCGESERDLKNLNNPSVMNAYYKNFELLMKRLGAYNDSGVIGYGGAAIVHIEPDLAGFAQQGALNNANCYGQCSAQGNDARFVKSSAASSGYPLSSGLPNNFLGYNQTLMKIRDKYAPNVQLAYHVSGWGTGYDISTNKETTRDFNALAQQAATFAKTAGVDPALAIGKGFEHIYQDIADRDAGYYKYVNGDSSKFWDRTNATLPNFTRWENYSLTLYKALNKPQTVWQIPLGNQNYKTMNNTNGHYQDNKIWYLLNNQSKILNAGITTLLFGSGNPGSTYQYDNNKDGITNPASFCTTDGTSGPAICNTGTALVSDDDGGYLRMKAQQYLGKITTVTPLPTTSPSGTTTTTNSLYVVTPIYPTNGSVVTGTVVFKAKINNLSLNEYSMAWDVDGGNPNLMTPNAAANQMEATVDVSGWNWKGTGPYTINFTAKNAQGAVINTASVSITRG